jgi:hypothetical protein
VTGPAVTDRAMARRVVAGRITDGRVSAGTTAGPRVAAESEKGRPSETRQPNSIDHRDHDEPTNRPAQTVRADDRSRRRASRDWSTDDRTPTDQQRQAFLAGAPATHAEPATVPRPATVAAPIARQKTAMDLRQATLVETATHAETTPLTQTAAHAQLAPLSRQAVDAAPAPPAQQVAHTPPAPATRTRLALQLQATAHRTGRANRTVPAPRAAPGPHDSEARWAGHVGKPDTARPGFHQLRRADRQRSRTEPAAVEAGTAQASAALPDAGSLPPGIWDCGAATRGVAESRSNSCYAPGRTTASGRAKPARRDRGRKRPRSRGAAAYRRQPGTLAARTHQDTTVEAGSTYIPVALPRSGCHRWPGVPMSRVRPARVSPGRRRAPIRHAVLEAETAYPPPGATQRSRPPPATWDYHRRNAREPTANQRGPRPTNTAAEVGAFQPPAALLEVAALSSLTRSFGVILAAVRASRSANSERDKPAAVEDETLLIRAAPIRAGPPAIWKSVAADRSGSRAAIASRTRRGPGRHGTGCGGAADCGSHAVESGFRRCAPGVRAGAPRTGGVAVKDKDEDEERERGTRNGEGRFLGHHSLNPPGIPDLEVR